jgi:integrase
MRFDTLFTACMQVQWQLQASKSAGIIHVCVHTLRHTAPVTHLLEGRTFRYHQSKNLWDMESIGDDGIFTNRATRP